MASPARGSFTLPRLLVGSLTPTTIIRKDRLSLGSGVAGYDGIVSVVELAGMLLPQLTLCRLGFIDIRLMYLLFNYSGTLKHHDGIQK